MIDTLKITQSKIVPMVRFHYPQKKAWHDAIKAIISPALEAKEAEKPMVRARYRKKLN
ncbi:hypothetical protein [Mesorhizobium japonicum]|uniref:hypothetical protein n=1 Tax=Mesorhizobium japonicum TaxID=2066070 RepID=UPI0012FF4633|nr:hypothetical protein [Mesorhizobium japonicum]